MENTKNALTLVARFKKQYQEAAKDGIQAMDGFGFIDELAELPAVINSAKLIKEEIDTVTPEGRDDVRNHVLTLDVVEKEEAEQFIADVVEWALLTNKVIRGGIAL